MAKEHFRRPIVDYFASHQPVNVKANIMDLGMADDSVHILELSVVIAAQNHNPTILNPDFLSRNRIAPADWELAQAPVCVEPFAQVQYTNGISVVSELQKIVFTQPGEPLAQESVKIVEMAHQYVKTVPHVDYKGVGINPKGDVGFLTEDGPRRYIMEKLIAQGPWQNYGQAPVKGSAVLIFQLKTAKLFLSVQEAKRKTPNGVPAPVVIFSGNFHYDLPSAPRSDLKALGSILESRKSCWTEFTTLINSVFL